MAAVANILVWVTLGVVVLMVAGLIFYLLKRLLAWLVAKDSLEGPPLTSKTWFLNLLKGLAALPVRLWRLLVSLFKRIDSAAVVYVRLLRWGRRCGLSKKHTETPDEYAGRLMHHFPGLDQEIRLIVDAFDHEIYGLIETGPGQPADIVQRATPDEEVSGTGRGG
jgi:hypothetical protein